jgi:hypothetical protein
VKCNNLVIVIPPNLVIVNILFKIINNVIPYTSLNIIKQNINNKIIKMERIVVILSELSFYSIMVPQIEDKSRTKTVLFHIKK